MNDTNQNDLTNDASPKARPSMRVRTSIKAGPVEHRAVGVYIQEYSYR